jgi:hypothetical protein
VIHNRDEATVHGTAELDEGVIKGSAQAVKAISSTLDDYGFRPLSAYYSNPSS